MNCKFLLVLSILLLSGFASASHQYTDDVEYKEKITKTYYNNDRDYAITKTIYASYDNDNRYSSFDYLHGYSYRESEDYWMRHHDYVDYNDVRVVRADDNRNRNMHNSYDSYDDDFFKMDTRYDDWRYADEPKIQKRYISYLNAYEYQECYDYAPKGKLFYVEC